jgi:uncharacterized protein (DUF1330 family)
VSVAPTPAQLAALRDGDPTERIALVRLLRVAEREAYARWLAEEGAAVRAAGGRRSHHCAVDAVLTSPEVAFHELIVDEFPSRELAAESLRLASPHAERALAEAVVLAARPRRLPALWLGAAKAWLRLRHGRRAKRPGALPPDAGNRAIEPAPEDFGAFLAKEPERPLLVLNLNRHRDRAEYARYGRNTLPHLLRRGDGPVFAAGSLPAVVGPESHPLMGPWDEILLVRYESRSAMLDMLRDPEYQRGLPHRERGLRRAGLVAACPLPEASGHSGKGASRSRAGGPAGEAA